MRSPSFILLSLLLLLVQGQGTRAQVQHPPAREVRAVWLATAVGLDWPKTTDRQAQRDSLRAIVERLHNAHFNTIFFQVRSRGDAYYRSRYEPWAENLTGTLGKDPGWDPLSLLLELAHARNMEVHAWFNVYKIRSGGTPPQSVPEHPSRTYPAWTVEYDGETWFDPGIPEVSTYLMDVALDLVRTYDIDGINFDYIRYPGRAFADETTFARYGKGMAKDDWRRENINRFVRDFYRAATRLKPMLKVGSSPLGVYRNGTSNGSYHSYYQDSFGWLREGVHDYLVPQVYWTMSETRQMPDYAVILRKWQELQPKRQVLAGIAAYRPEVLSSLSAYIDTARSAGLNGQAFFRYESLGSFESLAHRYDAPALIPPMPWKDPIPPLAPTDLAVTEAPSNIVHLRWTPPRKATDGDTARCYGIYRWTSPEIPWKNPQALLSIPSGSATTFTDSLQSPNAPRYYYAVTAFDKGHNEGAPSNVGSALLQQVQELASKLPHRTSLALSLSNNTGRPLMAAYSLTQRTSVQLDLFRHAGQNTTELHTPLVRAVQDEGTYMVSLSELTLDAGDYLVRLMAGEAKIEQAFSLGR
jgi:uncharacterized lipoprotein YddW (UPF0748 family)